MNEEASAHQSLSVLWCLLKLEDLEVVSFWTDTDLSRDKVRMKTNVAKKLVLPNNMIFVISGYHHCLQLNRYIGCIYLNLRVFPPHPILQVFESKSHVGFTYCNLIISDFP